MSDGRYVICPHCGGSATTYEQYWENGIHVGDRHMCINCGCQASYDLTAEGEAYYARLEAEEARRREQERLLEIAKRTAYRVEAVLEKKDGDLMGMYHSYYRIANAEGVIDDGEALECARNKAQSLIGTEFMDRPVVGAMVRKVIISERRGEPSDEVGDTERYGKTYECKNRIMRIYNGYDLTYIKQI